MGKLQQLPVMDRMFIGANLQRAGIDPQTLENMIAPFRITKDFFLYLSSFKRIKLDDSERMAKPDGARRQWNVQREFGHLLLPFPRVWIEWNNQRGGDSGEPDLWMSVMCVHQTELEQFSKLWFEDNDFDSSEYRCESNSWAVFPLILNGGRVLAPPMMLLVDLDEFGVLHGVRGVDMINFQKRPVGDVQTTAEIVDLVWDALVAVGWMNCRNVSIVRQDRNANLAGTARKRSRNQARGLDFHTIKLPGVEYATDGTSNSTGRHLRMHHVRGHFKTFKPDAPLLGMHTGTYWWGWQVRGHKDSGTVVSDYALAMNAGGR